MSCEEMNYEVLVSKTFQKKFYQLQKNIQILLKKEPYSKSQEHDIKLLKDTRPKKYRLRIGDYRIIYIINQKEIKIIDLLIRESGYTKLD